MHLFKKKDIAVDERIVNSKNKIYKEMYLLILAVCILSIVVKYALYGMNTHLVITELVILLAQGIYYVVRSVGMGIFSDDVEVHDRTSKVPMGMKNLISGLFFGVALAIFFGVRSAMDYGETILEQIWYFILVFFASLMIYAPFFGLILAIVHFSAMKISKNQTKY
ncbi:DUF6773 family protein [Metabacillus arenae]|uniref:Uncharacterized protein n=1 Tax=Metabacillus arenae TaxID=2771434 RepID=A0A926NKM1_9BACI|nr:DUF6773 family protein [Metabacillus arenae]MBD1379782.1 hypothetical protein [Metabacillus arenae]